MRFFRTKLSLMLAWSLVSGCSSWDVPTEPVALPAPQGAGDTVLLEVEFIRLPLDSEATEQFWQEVDEQHLPEDVRRTLSANGLRCGLMGSQLPPLLRRVLDAKQSPVEQLKQGEFPEAPSIFQNYQVLQSRPGKTRRITATPVRDTMVVLVRDGEERLRAEHLAQAQGMFSCSTVPLGDGRVRLQLLPMVEAGETRQQWVAGPGMMMLKAGRDTRSFDTLLFETVLAPGQTVMVTSTHERKGLGGQFFAGDGQSQGPAAMLIRLAQSQYDALFSESPVRTPLATPVE